MLKQLSEALSALQNLDTWLDGTGQKPKRSAKPPAKHRPGLQRTSIGRVYLISSPVVQCPHCKQQLKIKADQAELIEVRSASGQVLHTEIE